MLSDRQNKVQMRKNTNMVPGNYCMCQPKVKFVDLYNKKEFVDLYNAFDTTKSFFKCCQNTETLPILCTVFLFLTEKITKYTILMAPVI